MKKSQENRRSAEEREHDEFEKVMKMANAARGVGGSVNAPEGTLILSYTYICCK